MELQQIFDQISDHITQLSARDNDRSAETTGIQLMLAALVATMHSAQVIDGNFYVEGLRSWADTNDDERIKKVLIDFADGFEAFLNGAPPPTFRVIPGGRE